MLRSATVNLCRTLIVLLAPLLSSQAQSVLLTPFPPPGRDESSNFSHKTTPQNRLRAAAAYCWPNSGERSADILPLMSHTCGDHLGLESSLDHKDGLPDPPPMNSVGDQPGTSELDRSRTSADTRTSSAAVSRAESQPPLDRDVYYRNKVEFAFDGGWLPINIPFVFDVFLGDAYTRAPLDYTLVPLIASLRWHINDVSGPWILRGNWDMTVSGSATLIPRGPESHYFSYDMGIRRNFVPRRGKIAPYFDGRLGLGRIDAKEPLGVQFAQGQNFTFTVNMGAGARYNFSPRYSLSAGLNWMHISNLYLSEPAFSNYGINVYGPMFGIDVRLGKPRHGPKQ